MASPGTGRYCAEFHGAVELIGRRWNGVILQAVMRGADRFADIRDAVPGLSDRLLARRLRELEVEGIVVRRCPPDDGGRPRYELTVRGERLSRVFDAISEWAAGPPAPR